MSLNEIYEILYHKLPSNEELNQIQKEIRPSYSIYNIVQTIIYQPSYILNLLKEINENYKPWKELKFCKLEIQNLNTLFQQNCDEISIKISKLNQQNMKKHFLNFYTTIEPSKAESTNINVFMCCRNNEVSLNTTLNNLIALQNHFKFLNFNYFFYENDSNDKTPNILMDFCNQKNINGKYSINKFDFKQWGNVQDLERSKDMAFYRNENKNMCNNFEKSDYCIILDTDVQFSPQTFENMYDLLNFHKDIQMVTPFGFANDDINYYDTYALETLQHENNINLLIPPIYEVKSAFGGFVMIRTKTFKECYWSKSNTILNSEHNEFCKRVRDYGKIVIARDIHVHWHE